MRRAIMAMVVAVAASLLPTVVRAENPNQVAAQKIKEQLSKSGQLETGDRVAVRYLNGTVWLQGHVRDPEHFTKVVSVVFSTEGVAINQVIRDDLKIDAGRSDGMSDSGSTKVIPGTMVVNPLRPTYTPDVQQLPSSFSPTHAATPVNYDPPTPVPAPTPPIPTPPAAPAKLPAAESAAGVPGAPLPMYAPAAAAGGPAPVRYDRACMPGYAWPSYAAYPNYAAVTYPKQYSPTAWPYIGPFYPYPQVPLGWRKVSLQWDDGWWWLDFKDKPSCAWWR